MSLFAKVSSARVAMRSALLSTTLISTLRAALPATVIPVRTATKKAAGSRTSMRDSAGRRLGVKKQDGTLVKIGDIIVRQRGTRFFPGENCKIGRDHTIYAVEPGYVRIYLDPFHPKRRLIGVALEEHLLLPTPHFAPRVRRFGYAPIERAVDAQAEEARMLKQEALQLPEQLAAEAAKRAQDAARQSVLALQIVAFVELPAEEQTLAGARLLAIENQLRNGRAIADAQSITSFDYHFDIRHEARRAGIAPEETERLSQQYQEMASKVDAAVSFHSLTFDLIPHMSATDMEAAKAQLVEQLRACVKTKKALSKDIDAAVVFSAEERALLKRDYLSEGIAGSVKVFNKDTRKVEVIDAAKLGFVPTL
ncbi:hypothetical protein BABINDRAFT_162545 [Babjeviella inositovora NRRL Y-12698]|uniref:Large ribosomal subunit protein bL27m n=1 Tax=Babjeviella inositovora NRRL Y-12698 TaxID=984486 RepID=A0A1E3QMG3_9ASCO|nr:uncharacterized protein BABINDRAFT_162545 [Babjeviella inositovora NRRL Y-12698]ODQ78875.1 hypothetical protein BABINDRAFT_162545 [Babjeviella inositovora NRRL Y-12698]